MDNKGYFDLYKNKLFRRYFKSNDVDKRVFYRKYLNKLTHIKYHAKRNYYENLIKTNNQNSSHIWSIIKEIIECKKILRTISCPLHSLLQIIWLIPIRKFFLTLYASTLQI